VLWTRAEDSGSLTEEETSLNDEDDQDLRIKEVRRAKLLGTIGDDLWKTSGEARFLVLQCHFDLDYEPSASLVVRSASTIRCQRPSSRHSR
jgi:hypothetical protein